jgi:hypothetical protein
LLTARHSDHDADHQQNALVALAGVTDLKFDLAPASRRRIVRGSAPRIERYEPNTGPSVHTSTTAEGMAVGCRSFRSPNPPNNWGTADPSRFALDLPGHPPGVVGV